MSFWAVLECRLERWSFQNFNQAVPGFLARPGFLLSLVYPHNPQPPYFVQVLKKSEFSIGQSKKWVHYIGISDGSCWNLSKNNCHDTVTGTRVPKKVKHAFKAMSLWCSLMLFFFFFSFLRIEKWPILYFFTSLRFRNHVIYFFTFSWLKIGLLYFSHL